MVPNRAWIFSSGKKLNKLDLTDTQEMLDEGGNIIFW